MAIGTVDTKILVVGNAHTHTHTHTQLGQSCNNFKQKIGEKQLCGLHHLEHLLLVIWLSAITKTKI